MVAFRRLASPRRGRALHTALVGDAELLPEGRMQFDTPQEPCPAEMQNQVGCHECCQIAWQDSRKQICMETAMGTNVRFGTDGRMQTETSQ